MKNSAAYLTIGEITKEGFIKWLEMANKEKVNPEECMRVIRETGIVWIDPDRISDVAAMLDFGKIEKVKYQKYKESWMRYCKKI